MRLGPKSFLVLSDPGAVRQVLVGAVDKYRWAGAGGREGGCACVWCVRVRGW